MKLKELVGFFQGRDYQHLLGKLGDRRVILQDVREQDRIRDKMLGDANQAGKDAQKLLKIATHLTVLGKQEDAVDLLQDALENGDKASAYQEQVNENLSLRRKHR